MPRLFTPLTLRGVMIPNRAWVSPMCQYSSVDGHPTDWHLVHLGALARGGAGLVFTEATAVSADARISPSDAGIWTDAQAADYERIMAFVHEQGAVTGMQLAHAGRKASTEVPWLGRGYVEPADGGWATVGPSPVGYAGWPAPRELSAEEIGQVAADFAAAAVRADAVGVDVVEIHAAHGYLLHEFLSPLSNHRTDRYGTDRGLALLEVVDAVRTVWPERKPLFVRVSATDWVEGGWDVEQTVELCTRLAERGVDLIDVSSGGNSPDQKISVGPGYQVPFARAVRVATSLPVAAVGLITEPTQAEQILLDGAADAVLLARALLREPSWPQRAATELGGDVHWAPQYERAKP